MTYKVLSVILTMIFTVLFLTLIYKPIKPFKELFSVLSRPTVNKAQIPLVVHQVYTQGFHAIPECVRQVMQRNRKSNPDYEFRLYDIDQMKQYLRKNTEPIILKTFNLINPTCHACLADFFRYVVIYYEGGIYLDIKTEINTPLRDWVHNDIHLSMWPWFSHSSLEKYYPTDFVFKTNNRELNQSVLMYPPKHPVLAKVVKKVIMNIQKAHKHKDLQQSVLEITGPHAYTEVIAKDIHQYNFIVHQSNEKMFDGHIIYDGTKGEYHKHIKQRGNSWQQNNERKIL
jgi:inositol phosphorylceramide mannosyltransferase catalytic subunit